MDCVIARTLPAAKHDVQQRDDAAHQVHAVQRRQQVEEAAAGVGDQENALRGKLAPGNQLADQKQNAERGGDAPTSCRKAATAPSRIALSAIWMVTLLASRTSVLNQIMRGSVKETQSLPRPLRTRNELVSAMKNMMMPARPAERR